MLHVAEDATRVIELGPIRGGESRNVDLAAAYHAYGRLFDSEVYAQRGATAAEDFVRRALNPGECNGILMNGQDMGGILKLAGARVPEGNKAQVAALHEILSRSGGHLAAPPRA